MSAQFKGKRVTNNNYPIMENKISKATLRRTSTTLSAANSINNSPINYPRLFQRKKASSASPSNTDQIRSR